MFGVRIAKGWRGEIWIDIQDGQKIATKKALDESKIGSIHREIQILTYLNNQGCDFVPQLRDTQHDSFSYIYIEGLHFEDIYEENKQKKGRKGRVHELLLKLLRRAYQLDQLGAVHGEFLRPYKNMIVCEDDLGLYTISIIDFERGTLQDTSGKNMRHLAQRFLTEGYIDIDLVKGLGRLSCDAIYQNLCDGLHLFFE